MSVYEPRRIFSFSHHSNKLYCTFLETGEDKVIELLNCRFKVWCSWCEAPDGKLYITGGARNDQALREVNCVDTMRDFNLTLKWEMLKYRMMHGSAYFGGFVYVVGGFANMATLISCERFSLATQLWEAIPNLPLAVHSNTLVVNERTGLLHSVGGAKHLNFESVDFIQELNLFFLTWKLLGVRLQAPSTCIACFNNSGDLYLLLRRGLYKYFPTEDVALPVIWHSNMLASYCGPAYFYEDTVYTSCYSGPASRLRLVT